MYAIVRTGGKQYKVSERTVFTVEKLAAAEGETVELTDVLLLSDGETVTLGSPTVEGAKVTATVLETGKGRKVRGFTYKPTKNIQRHYGHRQWHTRLRVDSIEGAESREHPPRLRGSDMNEPTAPPYTGGRVDSAESGVESRESTVENRESGSENEDGA